MKPGFGDEEQIPFLFFKLLPEYYFILTLN